MNIPTQTSEASLLFAAPLARDVSSEIPELTRCLDSLGWPVDTTRAVPGDLLILNCGAVQITIAQSALPFDLADFRGVARPGPEHDRDDAALARLEAHQACVTVLVAEQRATRRPVSAAVRRRICWEVTDLIAEALGAEMVFWGETDMLYFCDEFAAANLAQAHGPAFAADPPEVDARRDACHGAARWSDAPDLPFTSDAPGLDFLDPLREDRRASPDIAARVATATPEEIAEAEQFLADRAGLLMARRRPRDYASVALLSLIGLALASLSVMNGLIPLP